MASLKAIIQNRLGDMGITVAILLTLNLIEDLSFHCIFAIAATINRDIIMIITILLLIGATAKSAQFGLHTWLASAVTLY
jgi:NADH:ubiquinone oxidoreductase subunit 5 (subunit L)/multisubunit Na+/H+ antiporter MnhA subunit